MVRRSGPGLLLCGIALASPALAQNCGNGNGTGNACLNQPGSTSVINSATGGAGGNATGGTSSATGGTATGGAASLMSAIRNAFAPSNATTTNTTVSPRFMNSPSFVNSPNNSVAPTINANPVFNVSPSASASNGAQTTSLSVGGSTNSQSVNVSGGSGSPPPSGGGSSNSQSTRVGGQRTSVNVGGGTVSPTLNTQATGGAGGQGGTSSAVGGGQANNSISLSSPRNAPPAMAPALAPAGIESCNGSVAVGGSMVGGGGAFGFPWQDGPCNIRLNARALWNAGMRDAAIQELCLDQQMAEALVSTGVQCAIGPRAWR